jgi:phage shock protein A|tara:strand:+ start:240 stop:500 length:261 start_codon:yes stop_codon:yes gene_type:complete
MPAKKAQNRREKAKSTTPTALALKALERIAQHEKECGERWAECTIELRELKNASKAHAARWERLAWLVIGTVITTALAGWITMILK